MTGYRVVHSVLTVKPVTEDRKPLRIQVAERFTIDVDEVKLTEWPDGACSITVHGRHVRLDGYPGRHHRGHQWWLGEPLPEPIAEIVEHARPNWGNVR